MEAVLSNEAPLCVDSEGHLNERGLDMLRHNLKLSPEELQDEARTLLEERGRKAEAARKLKVTRGTITNALNTDTPSRYLQTLIGIIAAMSDYTIEAETVTVCRVVKKAE